MAAEGMQSHDQSCGNWPTAPHPATKKGRINAPILPKPARCAKSDRLLDISLVFSFSVPANRHMPRVGGRVAEIRLDVCPVAHVDFFAPVEPFFGGWPTKVHNATELDCTSLAPPGGADGGVCRTFCRPLITA